MNNRTYVINLLETQPLTCVKDIKDRLRGEVEGFVADLLTHNREGDPSIPKGVIEQKIYTGELDIKELTQMFHNSLNYFTNTMEGLQADCY